MRVALSFLGLAGAGLVMWACSSDSGTVSSSDAGPAVPTVDASSIVTCNGHAELCDRAYTAVAFPGTHDAYATVPDNFVAADQDQTVAQQLDGGIRVLHMEMLPYQGDVYVCHAVCGIGAKLLSDELAAVSTFATGHPYDVVTLLLESNQLTTDQIEAVFNASGIEPMLQTVAAGTPWPTLKDMIASGKHVVVFLADLSKTGGTTFPFFHDRFARTWETPWDNKTPQDFARCDADRGTKGNDVYVVDTYREDTTFATIDQAETVNPNPFLIDRLLHCKSTESTLPNFVMVNFYEVGDVLKDVDILNGFEPEPSDTSGFPPANWPGSDAGTDAGDAGLDTD